MVMTNINKENFGMVKLGLRKMKNKAFKCLSKYVKSGVVKINRQIKAKLTQA